MTIPLLDCLFVKGVVGVQITIEMNVKAGRSPKAHETGMLSEKERRGVNVNLLIICQTPHHDAETCQQLRNGMPRSKNEKRGDVGYGYGK